MQPPAHTFAGCAVSLRPWVDDRLAPYARNLRESALYFFRRQVVGLLTGLALMGRGYRELISFAPRRRLETNCLASGARSRARSSR